MAAFLVTATVRDTYRQTVDARDEREATAIAQRRPNAWSVQSEDATEFDARQVLRP